MKQLLFFLLIPWLIKAQDMPNPSELIIDNIVCEGNDSTSCDLIQKEIYLNIGDRVNEEELSNARIRLQLKNLFKSVNIFMKKGTERGHVNIVVEVIEGNPFFMEVDYQLQGTRDSNFHNRSVSMGHRNLFGLGKTFRFTYNQDEYSWQTQKYFRTTFSYIDPNLFGIKKLFFNINASFERPLSSNNQDNHIDYVYEKNDAYSFLLGYRIFDFSYISISQTKYDSVARYENSKETYSHTKIEDSVTYGWNSEDDSYFASSGSKFALSYVMTQPEPGDFYSSVEDRSFQKVYFKKNWTLAPKNFFSISSDIYRLNGSRTPEYQSNSSFLYSYQLKDRLNGVGSRSRLFFDVNPIAGEYYSTVNYSTGYMTEFAGFGFLKLGLTYWGSL
ncbi:MAG: hypothetical protein JNM24_17875 [Bdellovibrionaceae bacterium]|nr:hypothetical protein [Pseudobdellovibrionaceae bacterium]